MPARSQAQRALLNAKFGHEWVKEHHFDNKGKLPEHVKKDGIPGWANYRPADVGGISCATCDWFTDGKCEMFENTPVEAGYTCDEWGGRIDKDDAAIAPMYTAMIPPPVGDTPEGLRDLLGAIEPDLVWKAGVTAAGLAVRAADTGRVLMLQRQSGDAKDPASGQWEFPGGNLNVGEHPYIGAKREWQEEMGQRLPKGNHVGSWQSGVYQGFVHEIPSESAVKLNLNPEDRRVSDPDGDGQEAAAWWDPEHMKRSRAVRQELHDSRAWVKVAKPRPSLSRFHGRKLGKTFVTKGQARPAMLHLRVNGVSRHPDGGNVYRMVTRDGHYVGRTNSTRFKARKGDVLKIEANDFSCDMGGDYHWMNPNVVSGYVDTAHSWRELEALAGGELVKDFAAGPAGDAPPAGDSPTGSSQMPSAGTMAALTPAATSEVPSGDMGPTLRSVHRNKPLKNISVAYLNRNVKVHVHKADKQKQLVYGVVLEPNALDSQDDYMLPDQVERAAHGYMKKVVRGKASVSKLQHRTQAFFKNKNGVVPVESYIAPCDFTLDGVEMVKKGTWVMCVHVEDPDIWNGVLSGEYTGFSIGGTGVRRSMHIPPDVVDRGYIGTRQASDW